MIPWQNVNLHANQQEDTNVLENRRQVPVICTPGGILYVSLATDDGQAQLITPENDGVSEDALEGMAVSNVSHLYNESTFDRERNNTTQTILASAARTASTDSADFTNYNARGAHFYVDVTAVTGSPSIEVKIQSKDPVSGGYYNLLVSTAITAVSVNILKIYPGIGAVANASASDILPRIYRVSVTHANADSITYSVGASLVL